MFAKIEQRTSPFPSDWLQAPPQRLFAFIRYYCRGFYAPLVIIMLAGIGVAVLEVLLFGFIGDIVNWLGARSPDTLLQEEGWRLAGMALVVLVLLPLCGFISTVARNQVIMGNMPMAVRWRMHNYLLGQSLSFYQDEFSGRVSAKVMQTALAVRAVVISCMDVMVYVVAYFFSIIALMATKAACIYAVARLAKSSHADALDRAVIMAQGGEFAFVLFSGALGKGVIDETANANMTAIVVLSMVFTPLMIILHNRFAKAEEMETRAADTIHEQKPIIVIGMGRFGQAINKMLNMSGYETTIIDMDPVMVQGFTKYSVKTHFGDASRHELLIAAGIEKAQMLVVAIDNREQALQIVRFAREINPNTKILARAFDRLHTFDLYQAGADEIVREVFDSAIRAGKTTLKMLGTKKDIAEKLATYYFHSDRNKMVKQARVHDSALGPFQNQQMIEISQAYDLKMEDDIAAIMRGEDAPDPRGEADEDD